MFDVIPKILPKFIYPKRILKLLNSKSNPPFEKKKPNVNGIAKEKKESYDSTKKFQAKWASKLTWIEGLIAKSGFIHNVKCKVCSLIKNKGKIVGRKWDILTKHVGHRIVVWDLLRFGVKKGGTYIAKDCAHLKIMKLYVQRGHNSIFGQNKQTCE
jgi:hypothetical protein